MCLQSKRNHTVPISVVLYFFLRLLRSPWFIVLVSKAAVGQAYGKQHESLHVVCLGSGKTSSNIINISSNRINSSHWSSHRQPARQCVRVEVSTICFLRYCRRQVGMTMTKMRKNPKPETPQRQGRLSVLPKLTVIALLLRHRHMRIHTQTRAT